VFTAHYGLGLFIYFNVHFEFKVFVPTRYGAIPVGEFSLQGKRH